MVEKGKQRIVFGLFLAAIVLGFAFLLTQPAPPVQPAPEGPFTKVSDEPGWETHFVQNQIVGPELVVVFYHDAQEAQPVWIEGDINYSFSTDLAQPGQEVTLRVPLVNGEVPQFRLHVGPDSETFTVTTRLTLPDNTQTVYVPGAGMLSPTSDGSWTSAPDWFIASFKDNVLYALVHSYQLPVSMELSHTSQGHTLTLVQRLTNSRAFLVLSEGDQTAIHTRMPLIEAYGFLGSISPTFGYGLGAIHPIKLLLDYADLDVQGSLKLQPGEHELVLESNRTDGARAVTIGQV